LVVELDEINLIVKVKIFQWIKTTGKERALVSS